MIWCNSIYYTIRWYTILYYNILTYNHITYNVPRRARAAGRIPIERRPSHHPLARAPFQMLDVKFQDFAPDSQDIEPPPLTTGIRNFLHFLPVLAVSRAAPCRHLTAGRCGFGDKCKFSHESGAVEPAAWFGRGDDTVGNPHRARISQFDFFELILLLKLDKQLPVERFEATGSQSTVPSPPLSDRACRGRPPGELKQGRQEDLESLRRHLGSSSPRWDEEPASLRRLLQIGCLPQRWSKQHDHLCKLS